VPFSLLFAIHTRCLLSFFSPNAPGVARRREGIEKGRRFSSSSLYQRTSKEKDAAVNYSTRLCLLLTTTLLSGKPPRPDEGKGCGPATLPLEDHLEPSIRAILELAEQFRAAPVTGEAALHFEEQVQFRLRDLGRRLVQHTYNAAVPRRGGVC